MLIDGNAHYGFHTSRIIDGVIYENLLIYGMICGPLMNPADYGIL
jgi:hypothetical protein